VATATKVTDGRGPRGEPAGRNGLQVASTQQGAVAMLLTFDSEEVHAGRPMLPLWLADDPHMYFLTHRDSRKVAQVAERPQVAITVINAGCYWEPPRSHIHRAFQAVTAVLTGRAAETPRRR
jgi:hypothetical protein